MSRYSHVVFDLDGTIYDSNHANLQSLHDALSIVCPQKAIAYEELSRFAARSAKSASARTSSLKTGAMKPVSLCPSPLMLFLKAK